MAKRGTFGRLDNRGRVAATLLPMSENSQNEDMSQPAWKVCAATIWLCMFGFVFFQIDLPNSSPTINRTDVWIELPDLLFYSVIPHPDSPPAGWSNFPQRIPILFVGFWMLAGVWGLGHLLLRIIRLKPHLRRLERIVFAYGLGMSGVSLLVLGAGLLAQRVPDALSGETLGIALFVFALIEFALRRTWDRSKNSLAASEATATKGKASSKRSASEFTLSRLGAVLMRGQIPFGILTRGIVSLAMALFVMAMALGAMLPSTDFDVKEYHIQGPKEWFMNGAIEMLPHNVYTSFPFLTEMFHLLGMELSSDWYLGALAGKLVPDDVCSADRAGCVCRCGPAVRSSSRLGRDVDPPFDAVDLPNFDHRLRRRRADIFSDGSDAGGDHPSAGSAGRPGAGTRRGTFVARRRTADNADGLAGRQRDGL